MKGDLLKSISFKHSTESRLGQLGARAVVTHRDSVLAEEPREAPCPIVDSKLGAVLHIGARFRGIVLVVQHCRREEVHRGTLVLLDTYGSPIPNPMTLISSRQTLNNAEVGLNPAFSRPGLLNKAFPSSGELGGQIQFGC